MTKTTTAAITGTAALALALLTGCSVSESPAESTPATTTPASTAATAEDTSTSPAATDAASESAPGDDTTDSAAAAPATGDDPVFAAIDALLAEHGEATIVEIDREDDDSQYDIEAVIGDELRDFDVLDDGTVREDDDEDDDDDDIRKANAATMTAAEAIETALEGRDGQTLDDLELEEEDGTLRWEVGLDLESGDDGDELYVDDATGEVTQDD